MDKKINYKKRGILWLVVPAGVFVTGFALYPITMMILRGMGASSAVQQANQITHFVISMTNILSFVFMMVGIPLGIYYLSKHSAEQPIKTYIPKPPKAWYKHWWLIPLILILAFFTWACTREPSPEMRQALEKHDQQNAKFDTELRALFPEIQKTVPGLRQENGVKCYSKPPCTYAVVFDFDKKPSDMEWLYNITMNYTQKFTELKRKILEDNASNFSVIIKVKGFDLYNCKSQGNSGAISCGGDNQF